MNEKRRSGWRDALVRFWKTWPGAIGALVGATVVGVLIRVLW